MYLHMCVYKKRHAHPSQSYTTIVNRGPNMVPDSNNTPLVTDIHTHEGVV